MFPRSNKRLTTRLFLQLALSLALPLAAGAQQKAPAAKPAGQESGDKLDVSDLEKKYWAAKDTDFSVVQNRLYSKANRFALSANYGTMINDPWTEGPTFGLGLAYYFSERYGFELHYTGTDSRDNKATQNLQGQSGYPNHNRVKQFYGASFNWVPFYAKMSVLNSSIIYFDMAFSLGAGMIAYEQLKEEGNATQSAPAVTFDVSQHFFINRYLALRADFKNRWYQEEVMKYRTQAAGVSRTASSDITNMTILMFGLTLYY